jgi:hypothetical protein
MNPFMRMGAESHETGRLPGEDEMSNETSVISLAEGPPTHESKDKRGEEEMTNSESITARNPNPAETREMATKHTKESEDKKISGDCVWAMRCHGGTIVMAFGVKMRDFKKMRVLLAAAGIFVPDMTRLKRCGSFGGAMSKRERLRRAKKKDSVYPIGDGENKIIKGRSSDKKGAHDGTRTHVGMSERLDLHSKKQGSTSHQVTLVIGDSISDRGINLINTRA